MHASRPRRLLAVLPLAAALALLGGCGEHGPEEDPDHAHGHDHGHDHDHGHGHDHDHHGKHGGVLVESDDHKAHFEFAPHRGDQRLSLYLYDGQMGYRGIGDAPTLTLTGPTGPERVVGVMGAKEGEMAASEWHFAHALLAGTPEGRFQIQIGSKTYAPELAYAEHDGHGGHDGHDGHGGHDGHEGIGPHDGMVAAFSGPDGAAGFVELKLHDDKGDLELWIAQDETISQPMDLPLDSQITVTFTAPKATSVTLAVRNRDKNEDESGQANNRDGQTNYFIFPGDSGSDASWLMGTAFKGTLTITFRDGDSSFVSEVLTLIPHTHGAGDHTHD